MTDRFSISPSFEIGVYIIAPYRVLEEQNCGCTITTKGWSSPSLSHVYSFLLSPAFVPLSRVNHAENRAASNSNNKLHFQQSQTGTSLSSA